MNTVILALPTNPIIMVQGILQTYARTACAPFTAFIFKWSSFEYFPEWLTHFLFKMHVLHMRR